ncbi:MAG: aminoglycoside phosphotransferase family protein [Chloroflexi bacterium]|nr:MAG: aminoglycoside phosphotransferase family protein [Chloroflexota bacterium]
MIEDALALRVGFSYNVGMHPLSALEDFDTYCRQFTNATLWTPYVREVCRRHALPCQNVHLGVPGTCPVFLVDKNWVVKFFGRLFDGAQSCAAEREAGRLVGQDPLIRTAKLAAEGTLLAGGELSERDWPWPYLVFEYIQGTSLGEVLDQVALEDRLRAAREMGDTIRRIHSLRLAGSEVFPASSEPYLRLLERQRVGVAERQREWGNLPAHLVEQIDGFLLPPADLVDFTRSPHLIHADLTRDHLLGRLENGRWQSLAIIDFGDAMTGDLLYELCALHLDMFSGDRRLLAAFLDAYGLPAEQRANLPHRALSTALLHQFNVFAAVPEKYFETSTLAELADRLYPR